MKDAKNRFEYIVGEDGAIEGVRIFLTQGKSTVISLGDWPRVSRHRWYAFVDKRSASKWYAASNVRQADGSWMKLLLHRFIMAVPSGMDCHHRNNDGLDNRRENIERLTKSEHMSLTHIGHERSRGENNSQSKLTRKQVLGMRILHASGHATISQMADWAKVPYRTVYRAVNNRSWQHLPKFRMASEVDKETIPAWQEGLALLEAERVGERA